MQNKNEFGNIEIANSAIKDIVNITTKKVKGIVPSKKDNSYINVIDKKGEITIHVSIKVIPGIDVVKTCRKLQNDIHESLGTMLQVDIDNINISIDGFISEKK